MKDFHNTSMRSILHADKLTPNALLNLEFATTNLATIVVSKFVKFCI